MKVSMKTLAYALHENTKGKTGADLSESLEYAIDFMKKNQLMSKSKELIAELQKIVDVDEGIVRAKVTTSSQLSKKEKDELEENIKKRYQVKEVEIDIIEDKRLLQGIKIEILDETIDLSLAHQLHQLQTHLIKN